SPGIALELSVEATATIAADVAELMPALVNLVVNAIDAVAPAGGAVGVRCGVDETTAWVEISDDGPGIPSEVRAHLYEPFVTTKGGAGPGLGLVMVHNAVQRHGGTIELTSTAELGSRFRLAFPRV